jgi:WD40 repeat protein
LQCFNSTTKKPGLLFWETSAARPSTPRRELTVGYAAACSSDGKRLATLSEDKHTVSVWDLGSPKRLGSIARLDKEIRGVALDATGKLLAVADEGGTVRLWAFRGP